MMPVRKKKTMLPHIFIRNSTVPQQISRLIGRRFVAFTQFCFTWVDDAEITKRELDIVPILKHEWRHVAQFYVAWVVGVVGWKVLTDSWLLLLLTPLTLHAGYGIASVIAAISGKSAYKDNWFEVDARRYTGERK